MTLDLKNLGQKTIQPTEPSRDILETVPAPYVRTSLYVARFTCPEFTSICPVTGQPDFANIIIDYAPDNYLIESKSLKLYLGSFRNHGAFHETCTMNIAYDFLAVAEPIWMRIAAFWYPRGGIPIDVFWQTGDPPDTVYIPPLENIMYRGR